MTNFKYLQKLFFLLVMGFSLCAVQACGDDEDDPVQNPDEEETVKPDGGKEEEKPGNVPVEGVEAVDLGLSVKWASCNVGADSPEEYGDYFAWGETTTKSDYNWDTYKWWKGTDDYVTKYCTDSNFGTVDNRTTLTSSDDVATVKWGSRWRMPTKEEMKELEEDCIWTWTIQDGVKGHNVKGPNGNSIFLPATGFRFDTNFFYRGSKGSYWSATLSESYNGGAYYLEFNDCGGDHFEINERFLGLTVRPVTE